VSEAAGRNPERSEEACKIERRSIFHAACRFRKFSQEHFRCPLVFALQCEALVEKRPFTGPRKIALSLCHAELVRGSVAIEDESKHSDYVSLFMPH